MASKLYIGGLAYSTTSEGLREFFTQCGNVQSATVITDRFSGQSRGFGFVEMGTAEEAQNSISQLNGRELDGRRITVEISNPRRRAPVAAAGPVAVGVPVAAAAVRRWRRAGQRLRAPSLQAREVVVPRARRRAARD